ncbi:prostate stem cell antigen-like isoform X2 [Parambassis ranga]|uniref:Prostate stem cell antigen-like isoform X2 n=1 Tax=Parambassis ranga TaxID=210632 RepID=A0A6P7J166_9TELE|nr:prostate stem cell antigen-like isoform X2 [Parambassis ranga]
MKFYGALVLLLTVSTACGLRCYTCTTTDPKSCTTITDCVSPFNRCFSLNINGVITKGCQTSLLCVDNNQCCETDLCNSAIPTGPSVILLLVSSAIITLFI